MFKAVLLGQWHSLSDPELEHSLITRIDFNLFCRFDELSIPDYSTLCRYRNRLAQDNTLSELLELINRQLTEKGLKIEKASAAVVKQRQAIEVDEEGQISGQTTPSKDKDARWIKKNGLYKLGYKQHTRTDAEGYIEKLHITPANAHECKHLPPLLEGIAEGTTVYADKGYDSAENRTSGRTSVAGRHYAQSLPQPSAVGNANQTQPVFVEDPLCGRTKLRYAAP